jgi:hypothetical protein
MFSLHVRGTFTLVERIATYISGLAHCRPTDYLFASRRAKLYCTCDCPLTPRNLPVTLRSSPYLISDTTPTQDTIRTTSMSDALRIAATRRACAAFERERKRKRDEVEDTREPKRVRSGTNVSTLYLHNVVNDDH